MQDFLLALDQGTTSSTALVMDVRGRTLGRATHELPQHFPADGWVEHEPEEIWASVVSALREALKRAGLSGQRIAAVGITNQRETSLLWDRASGKPVARAIVWQDRRTAEACTRLREEGLEALVRSRTGLVIDPYFSATKLAWLLDHEGCRDAAEQGKLCFGTVDTYLIWRLTDGARGDSVHVTDATNASRTLLMDLRTRRWDSELCARFAIPRAVLPRIVGCAEIVGRTRGMLDLPDGIPIAGVAGDQHAALFGQGCHELGQAKCTYGTGAFVLANTGAEPVPSRAGLLTTLGWQIGDQTVYALEGSCFIAGAAVQWLRDGLGIIRSSTEVEGLARQVESSDGVVFVPALSGLGAPHWDPEARGLLWGMSRATTAAHVAYATLEAIAFQVEDLINAMADDLGRAMIELRVDGGAAHNDLLMQLQADYSRLTVARPEEVESTARGAALLAGIGCGLLSSAKDAAAVVSIDRRFSPVLDAGVGASRKARWREAVKRCTFRS